MTPRRAIPLILCAASCHAAVFSTSFESEVFPEWSNPLTLGGPATRTNEYAHSGEHSMRLDGAWFYRGYTFDYSLATFMRVDFWSRGDYIRNGSRFRGGPSDDWVQHTYFAWQPVNATWMGFDTRQSTGPAWIDDVQVTPAGPADYYDHITNALAQLGAEVRFNQASLTQNRIARTMRALQDGTPLRIVMLGDSIINDMYGSAWHHLLPLRYPRAQVEMIASVRGGTGMDWYAAEYDETNAPVDRIQDWLFVHNPNFVIIGGISHNENSEAYRTVIQKIRARVPGMEILVTSGMAGRYDPNTKTNGFEIPTGTNSFVASIRAIAEEEGAAFLDTQATWDRFVVDSGKVYPDFLRDALHMNQNGTYIAAETMLRFFSSPTIAIDGAPALVVRTWTEQPALVEWRTSTSGDWLAGQSISGNQAHRIPIAATNSASFFRVRLQ